MSASTPNGDDLLSHIENTWPKLGIYLRRYVTPAIQSRGLPGQVLATPTDAPGPVQLQNLSDLTSIAGVGQIVAGTNIAISPPSGKGVVTISTAGGGTVTSVDMEVPPWQSVSGVPITNTGTIIITDNNQPANEVFAGPASGADAPPAFRALVAADIPSVPPSGAAGGDLSGTYPNPVVHQVNSGAVPVSEAYVGTNSSGQLIHAATPVSGINQLTGPVTAGPGTGSQATTITPTGVAAGTYTLATFSVATDGRVTSASSGSASAGNGLIQLLQFNTAQSGSGTVTTTFSHNTQPGSTIVVELWTLNNITTISDAQSNTYTRFNPQNWAGVNFLAQFVSVNIPGGTALAVTATGCGANAVLSIYEYNNVAAVDTSISAIGSGSSVPSGTMTTNFPVEVIHMTGASNNSASVLTNTNAWSFVQAGLASGGVVTNSYWTTIAAAGGVSNTLNYTGVVSHSYIALLALKPAQIIANPMTTEGDIIIGGVNGLPKRLAPGASGTVLTSNGSATDPSYQAGLVNPMTTIGDMIYGGASGVVTRLASGTPGNVLQTNGAAAPTWVSPSSGGFSIYPTMTPPLTANFSFSNPGGYAVVATDLTGRMVIQIPAGATGVGYVPTATLPSTPYTIDFGGICTNISAITLANLALISSGAAYRSFGYRADGTSVAYIQDQSWSSVTSPGAQNLQTGNLALPAEFLFIRITDDGTHRTIYYSSNGKDYTFWQQMATGAGITPVKAGFIFYNSGGLAFNLTIYHYLVSNSILPQFAP